MQFTRRNFGTLLLVALAPVVLTPGVRGAEPDSTELGRGITAYMARDFSAAVQHLKNANVPKLSDYAVYYLASAQQITGDFDGALKVLSAASASPGVPSPLSAKISLLHARVLLDKRDADSAAKALDILQANYKSLPEPDGDFALGLTYDALAEKPQAALAFEKVYYGWPNTDLAEQSWLTMARLHTDLGKDFPTPSARQKLDRCARWLDAKQYAHAREEYAVLAEYLDGPEKDEAKVGIGVADYLKGDSRPAFRYLKSLTVADHEINAERLYFLVETSRQTGDDTELMNAIADLNEHHAQSSWRLKALIAAGNRYFYTNERDKYAPLYQAAIDAFPGRSDTAVAHWRVAWDAYLGDKPERVTLLRDQVEQYPGESHANTALYFLGRIAEADGRYAEARAWYDRTTSQYPHYFYGVLARQRVQDEKKLSMAVPDENVMKWLADIDWPVQRDLSESSPNSATKQRLDRVRLLLAAGLPEVAESEGRFGAKDENEQPQILALELARSASSPFRALRIMKSLSGDYLSVPLESASMKFWQALFPLPYKDDLFRNARAHDLDPFYVAGLIRQESEFNPAAKSPARAYGLMQLLPSTGRLMGRQQGIRGVPTSLLLNPSANIRLGTQYLRTELDHWGGDWFQTLAAYNAGPTHVREWMMWGAWREPAEFVESIPFNETRDYVQAVLRNAEIYKEIYSGKLAADVETPAPKAVPRPAPKPARAAPKKSTTARYTHKPKHDSV
jgi:soluble lytic murein transglycosylase